MVLVSDYRYYNSYAIFNYGYFSNWGTTRDNCQGYQAGTPLAISRYRNLFTSGTPLAYNLPSITGERGRPMILLSTQQSTTKCVYNLGE